MKDRYIYPARFTADADGIAVEFPDLPGCFTCGDSVEAALDMAKDALGLYLYGLEQEGEAIPAPSGLNALQGGLAAGQCLALVEVWMPPVRGELEQRAVKKTLTIPKWLNDLGERHRVNFSHLLQLALKEYLGLAGVVPVTPARLYPPAGTGGPAGATQVHESTAPFESPGGPTRRGPGRRSRK